MKKAAVLVMSMCFSGYAAAQTLDKYAQCMDGLKTDPRFSSLAGHVALDGKGAPDRKLLRDKSTANEQQKQAIADWIDARAQCVNFAAGAGPAPVTLHMAFVSIVPDLYNGKMSFGDFNGKWQALYKKESKPVIPK